MLINVTEQRNKWIEMWVLLQKCDEKENKLSSKQPE
jgi:hypothetical protein